MAINEIDNRKAIKKINESKSWFTESINKTNKNQQTDKEKEVLQFQTLNLDLCGLSWWLSLTVQETQVRALAWEDPMRCGAPRFVHHNY